MAAAKPPNQQDLTNQLQPPAQAPVVNPVDAFFDDYSMAVEEEAKKRPKPRPRAPAQAPAPQQPVDIAQANGYKGKYASRAPVVPDGNMPSPEMYAASMPTAHDAQGKPSAPYTPPSNIASKGGAVIGGAMSGAPQETRGGWASKLSGELGTAAAPPKRSAHIEAFQKVVEPPKRPAFMTKPKVAIKPKLDSILGEMDGARLETMGQEFASLYMRDGADGGYKDDDLQQVYLGMQEHLRDRVRKGYKLKTMDESKLFEDD